MTYSVLSQRRPPPGRNALYGLGSDGKCPQAWNVAGKAQSYNCGGEALPLNCPAAGYCCPSESFTNAVYRSWFTGASLQYWNELRVRWVLQELISPTRGFSSYVDAYAYDHKAKVATGLVERLKAAQNRFLLLFPPYRWQATTGEYTVKSEIFPAPQLVKCSYTTYRTGLTQEVKKAMAASMPEALGALKNVLPGVADGQIALVGLPGWMKYLEFETAFWLVFDFGKTAEAVRQHLDGIDPKIRPWYENAVATVNAVPGGHDQAFVMTRPSPESVLTVTSGTVFPGGWLSSFLDAFAPVSIKPVARPFKVSIAKSPLLTLAHVPGALTSTVVKTEAPSSSTPWIVGGVVVAGALAAGGGYWLYRRKKKAG